MLKFGTRTLWTMQNLKILSKKDLLLTFVLLLTPEDFYEFLVKMAIPLGAWGLYSFSEIAGRRATRTCDVTHTISRRNRHSSSKYESVRAANVPKCRFWWKLIWTVVFFDPHVSHQRTLLQPIFSLHTGKFSRGIRIFYYFSYCSSWKISTSSKWAANWFSSKIVSHTWF